VAVTEPTNAKPLETIRPSIIMSNPSREDYRKTKIIR